VTRDHRLDRSALILAPPSGVDQIIASFGDVHKYIQPDGTLDPRWQTEFIDRVALPFPLLLSWDHSKSVRQFACHKRLTTIFASVFANILAEELQARVKSFGGCFAFRPERTSVKLSTHSWGIAIDLNPETNLQGSAGDMDAQVIKVFRDAGFEWGGIGAETGETRCTSSFVPVIRLAHRM
jgi:D-alanyl-D-alanine carboxypeptidase